MFHIEKKSSSHQHFIELYFSFHSLNLNEVTELEEKLLAIDITGSSFVFLHLDTVKYLDASALGMLLRYQKHLQHKRVTLVLLNINPTIRMLLELTKAKKLFSIFKSTEEALQELSSV